MEIGCFQSSEKILKIQAFSNNPISSKNQYLPIQKNEQLQSHKNHLALATLGCLATVCAGVALGCYFYKKGKTPLQKNNGLVDPQTIVNKVKQDFICLCKSVTCENYRATKQNINSGVFSIDLHSHSTHSDGRAYVHNLLDEVADYANHVYQKTGKKFTFALTDHDRVSGVEEALKIIRSNPKKYENINFIPGVEFSFAFNSNGQIRFGEMLAYFVDPSSKEMKILVEELNTNRLKMIEEGIKKLGQGFSKNEMDDYFINRDGETFAYCLHYRLFNYAQIKNRINKIAQERGENAEHLYRKFMQEYVFKKNSRVQKPEVSPQGFDKYLKENNIETQTPMLDENITKICEEFFPKIIDGKIVCKTENSFEKIIDTLKNNDDVVLAFAHPYFTAKHMKDYKKEFLAFLKYANGKILMSENYHQAYPQDIMDKNRSFIEEINDFLLSQNLIPIGGRDNHDKDFFKQLSS